MGKGLAKTLFYSAVVIFAFFAAKAFAGQNPQIFDCHLSSGTFVLYEPGHVNDLPMCVFGEAAIGSQSIANNVGHYGTDMATAAFLGAVQSVDSSSVCATYGATERDADADASRNYRVCIFSDGSVIEAGTLARGSNAPQNQGLKTALSLKF